jgi:hypothetical protein
MAKNGMERTWNRVGKSEPRCLDPFTLGAGEPAMALASCRSREKEAFEKSGVCSNANRALFLYSPVWGLQGRIMMWQPIVAGMKTRVG